MPGSYWQLFYHFIWATNLREPAITPEIREPLLRYIRKKCEDHRARVHAMGAVEDHVHLLVSLPANIAPSKFAADIKGSSSHFVNQEILGHQAFYWQEGYGVLTLAGKDMKGTAEYVDNQEERHRDRRLWDSLERTEGE